MAGSSAPTVSIGRFGELFVVVAVVLIVLIMVVPLPALLVDLLIAVNIGVSLLVLLLSMYVQDTLELSVFPSLLLVMTLFRLALNISSTRLILGHRNISEVPAMIEAFGNFVVGGNYVVGFVVFLILVIIQFVVITKGAERVAEVAARFTLDAMPGKQMSIDADLNAGVINDSEARKRRENVQREADFYGAMDGASKFVKGDAIAAILILVINVLGGFIIGMVQRQLSLVDALKRYSLLSVGDGLVTQIPALMISVATGIIVTRAAANENFGKDLISQFLVQPKILAVAGGALLAFSVIPGLPTLPFMVLGGLLLYFSSTVRKSRERSEAAALEQERVAELEAAKKPENVLSLLTVDPVELEIGYSLIPLVDPSQGGDLFDRVTLIRRQCALDLGLVIPAIRVRDNMQLRPGAYSIKIKGIEVGHGELMPNHFLAMNAGAATRQIDGVTTTEPAFGLPAIWLEAGRREEAEMAGYTVVDPPSVLVTHLTEIIKAHAHALLGRQEVKTLVDGVKESYPAVVEELIPDLLSVGEVQKVLQALLREGVSIRNLITILEVLADFARVTKDVEVLTEYVRQALGRQICLTLTGADGALHVATLDPAVEDMIASAVQSGDTGSYLAIDPRAAQRILQNLLRQVERLSAEGHPPVVACGGSARPHFKRLVDRVAPKVAVLSFNEIPPEIEVQAVGMVTMDDEG